MGDGDDESGGTAVPPSLIDSLTDDPKTWSESPGLISVSQVTPRGLSFLFRTAREMRRNVRRDGGDDRLRGKILATVFYEASTRTACSFQAAVMRLGGTYEHTVGSSSSTDGGGGQEELSKEIRRIESKCDAVVLRHPVKGSVGSVLRHDVATKPIINAGDGTGEHPTQALLDLFTICDELGMLSDDDDDGKNGDGEGNEGKQPEEKRPRKEKRDRLVVVLLGDLKHGRTVHSLAKLLARAGLDVPIVLRYVSPAVLEMPRYVRDHIASHASRNVKQESFDRLDGRALDGADVLYVTRVQRERFEDPGEYEKVKGSYIVDKELMKSAPSGTIVMHPLPRVDEISTDFDADPRAAYFHQMENGMFVRMALLALLLGKP